MDDMIETARAVFDKEAASILGLKERLTADFTQAVKLISTLQGKVIVTGMGKSGIVGQKIAATLASTGTSSFFMHPGEAFHGDLGMISEQDCLVAISNSGETEEVLKLIPFLKTNNTTVIALTGNVNSTLAKNASLHLDIGVEGEACPLKLAPTSSTTATMAMGDALAIAIMQLREFQPEDFARFHPGGSLGRKLLTKVADIMKAEVPYVTANAAMPELISAMSRGGLGMVLVGSPRELEGIVTDGDIRRSVEQHMEAFHRLTAKQVMTPSPKTLQSTQRVQDALEFMTGNSISVAPVEEGGCIVGALSIYHCENF